MSAIPTVSTQELDLAFASLRQLAFAAVFSLAALAAHGALAAGAAPEPDRTLDMAAVPQPRTLPDLTLRRPHRAGRSRRRRSARARSNIGHGGRPQARYAARTDGGRPIGRASRRIWLA